MERLGDEEIDGKEKNLLSKSSKRSSKCHCVYEPVFKLSHFSTLTRNAAFYLEAQRRTFLLDGRSLGSCECQSLNKGTDWLMARKTGQGEEEEVARARLQEEKKSARHEEKKM
ncbi:hypothetical protein STEG23_031171 [Scotinomys teguina]